MALWVGMEPTVGTHCFRFPLEVLSHCLSQRDWWSQECISHVCPVKDRVAPVSGLQDTGDPPHTECQHTLAVVWCARMYQHEASDMCRGCSHIPLLRRKLEHGEVRECA